MILPTRQPKMQFCPAEERAQKASRARFTNGKGLKQPYYTDYISDPVQSLILLLQFICQIIFSHPSEH